MARLPAVAGGAGCAAVAASGSGLFPAFTGVVSGKAPPFFGVDGAAGGGVLEVHIRPAAAKVLAADLPWGFFSFAQSREMVEGKATSSGKKRKKEKNIGKKFGNPLEKDSRIDV